MKTTKDVIDYIDLSLQAMRITFRVKYGVYDLPFSGYCYDSTASIDFRIISLLSLSFQRIFMFELIYGDNKS